MEGGAATPSGSHSGAGTADSHVQAGATGQPGQNKQVGVSKKMNILRQIFPFASCSYDGSCFSRLQHEVSLLQQQLGESRELIHSLQSELHVYDRVCSSTKANKGQYII